MRRRRTCVTDRQRDRHRGPHAAPRPLSARHSTDSRHGNGSQQRRPADAVTAAVRLTSPAQLRLGHCSVCRGVTGVFRTLEAPTSNEVHPIDFFRGRERKGLESKMLCSGITNA